MERMSFSLDKEALDFINNAKWDLRNSKSGIIRKILKYFKAHPDELRKIVNGEYK